jgi:D-alanyl-D-alanine carboxypeptidase
MRTSHPRSRRLAVLGLVVAATLLGAAACSDEADDATSTTTAGGGAGALTAETQAELQAATDAIVAANEIPGAVAAVWTADGGEWLTTVGVSDLDAQTPMAPDLTWPIRSVTKSFTVTVLLQLAEEGRVDLDEPISTYVPGFPNGDATLRQAAFMSTGVPEYTTQAFIDDFSADPTRTWTLDELIAYAAAEPPQFAPGEQHVYTNTNTLLIGKAIEEITGEPFQASLQDRVLDDLALSGTGYYPDAAGPSAPAPTGYQASGPEGELEPQPTNYSVFGPAGAMASTVDDLRTWAEALATGDGILSPPTQAERVDGATPLDEGPDYDVYALGIGEVSGFWGHTGEGFGITVLAMHDPDTGATAVILMNASGLDDHVPTQLLREFATILAT